MAKVVRNIGERSPSDADDVKPEDPTLGLGELDYQPQKQNMSVEEDSSGGGSSSSGGDVEVTKSIVKNDDDELQLDNDKSNSELAEFHFYGTDKEADKGWQDLSKVLLLQSNGDMTDIEGNIIYEGLDFVFCQSGETVTKKLLVKKEN